MEFFNRLLGRGAPVVTSRPGWPPAPQPQYPAAWSAKPAAASVSPATGLKGAGRLLGPVGVGLDIYETGRQVFNPQDNIITRTQRLGAGINNLIQGRPYLSGSAISQANPGQYYGPAYASAEAMGLPSRQGLRDYGPRYKEKELGAGAAAEAYRPGAGSPGQQSAADRDYESQKRRAEQLAQQDELSKKYRVADLTKAYNTAATPEEKEKIGLEIWATTNPQLAQKLKPGQLGYEQVQSIQTAQSPLGGTLQAAKNIELADKISFDAVPSTGFGIGFGANLNTQIPGVQVPANLQENIAGAFTSPVNVPSFDQAAKLFDPAKISEVDRATLIRLFNEGLQKK